MHLIVNEDQTQIASLLSKLVISLIKRKPNAVLGLATGQSPLPTYQLLVADHQKNKTDWSNVTTFNLDEYVGLSKSNPNSYHYFMEEHLFKHLNIKKTNTYLPSSSENGASNASVYEKLLEQLGPIDFQILGIGTNGHIGFNEPGSTIDSRTRKIDLKAETIQANKRFFNDDENSVPKQAITMGIATILKAKNIILIATGKNKAQAVQALIQGSISEQWPCSYLQKHPNVLVLVDKEAARLLDQTKIKETLNA